MRDGTIIGTGKSNKDWNCSAPHGAGRVLSRSEAKSKISLDKFEQSMKGIYSTTVCKGTLDEAPMAYKPKKYILDQIDQTIDIIDVMKPVYNFKAVEQKRRK
jgi:RNA-splicing ligase RtcB